MFIDQSYNLIVGFDDMSVFKGDEFKSNRLPGLDHFIKIFLNCVFFHSDLADFNADINVFHESHIKDFGEGKVLIGINFEANFLRDYGPVSFSESLLSQCGEERNFGSELIDLSFYALCNFKYVDDFLVFEIPDGMVEVFDWVFHKLFTVFSVDKSPFSVGPVLNVFDPIVGDEPQIAVREEIFGHFLDFRVIGNLFFEEVLPRVVFFGLGDRVLEGFVDQNYFLSDLIVLIFFIVGVELRNGSAQRFDVVLKLFLLGGQLLLEFGFTGLVLFLFLFHLIKDGFWSNHDQISFFNVFRGKHVSEILKNLIDFIGVLDFLLKLLQLKGNGCHVISDFDKFFNFFRLDSDYLPDLIELILKDFGCFLSFFCDQGFQASGCLMIFKGQVVNNVF